MLAPTASPATWQPDRLFELGSHLVAAPGAPVTDQLFDGTDGRSAEHHFAHPVGHHPSQRATFDRECPTPM
jgi:hypothetical protein